MSKEERKSNPFYGCITTFFMGGTAGYPLFDFFLEIFYGYQKRYSRLLEGHWINLCIAIAYEEFEWARIDIEKIGLNNKEVRKLKLNLNEPYSKEKWDEITKNQIVHKLDWRRSYMKTIDGKLTIYGYLNSL